MSVDAVRWACAAGVHISINPPTSDRPGVMPVRSSLTIGAFMDALTPDGIGWPRLVQAMTPFTTRT